MTCHNCRAQCRKYGQRNGLQRYQCCQCKKFYTEPHERIFDNLYTKAEDGMLALQMLLEGSSVRSTERITGLHRDTILALLVVAGEKCERVFGRWIVRVSG